jgi:hypothetical protein
MRFPMKSDRRSPGFWLLATLVVLAVSRALHAAFGFRYNVFRDPFDLGKLAIDLGVWAMAFTVSAFVLDRIIVPQLPRR